MKNQKIHSTITASLFLVMGGSFCAASNALETNKANTDVVKSDVAYFAGGCFWCIEKDFEALPGVISVVSGYTGGDEQNPTYEQVSSHSTNHIEAVKVNYNPSKVNYEQLVNYFYYHIDPLNSKGQFCDIGHQYTSAIFTKNESEKAIAQKVTATLEKKLNAKFYTEIVNYKQFWDAEEYHQDYHIKNPIRYSYYRASCGRDKRVKEVWNSHK